MSTHGHMRRCITLQFSFRGGRSWRRNPPALRASPFGADTYCVIQRLRKHPPRPFDRAPPRRGWGQFPSWEGCRDSGGVGYPRLSGLRAKGPLRGRAQVPGNGITTKGDFPAYGASSARAAGDETDKHFQTETLLQMLLTLRPARCRFSLFRLCVRRISAAVVRIEAAEGQPRC